MTMGINDREQNRKDERRAKASAKTPKSKSDYSHRFVRIELTADQKEEFKGFLAEGEFERLSVDDFLRVGYSVRFSSGDDGKTVNCTVTCSVDGDANYGLMLSGRGRDAATALAVCHYKDIYLCEGGAWLTGEHNPSKPDDDIG